MKIWFTTTENGDNAQVVQHLLTLARKSIQGEFNTRYKLAKSPDEADIIVYIESSSAKLKKYVYALLSEELILKYPNRCFVIDCSDTSWEIMPGCYTALRLSQVNRKRFRSGGYLIEYNPLCEKIYQENKDIEPKLLFSFRGSASSPFRKKLFEANFSASNISIQQIEKWFNHSTDELLLYAEEIINSKFVLCPRGICPASIRLFETMRMGRVPIILSDEWVAPEGLAWQDFSIRLSETRIHELPEIIKAYEPDSFKMGNLAREAWENWFSPDVIYVRMLNYIESIFLERDINHDEKVYQKEWLSYKFQWERGWTPVQIAARYARQGQLIKKLKSKFQLP